jgi:hypothetical protein
MKKMLLVGLFAGLLLVGCGNDNNKLSKAEEARLKKIQVEENLSDAEVQEMREMAIEMKQEMQAEK